MEFTNSPLSLAYQPPASISLIGSRLPTSRDTYYIAKTHEISQQYTAARLFLEKTTAADWTYWFNTSDDSDVQRLGELTMRAYLYETALTYYNIVVDLSWTICYLASEFSLLQRGQRIDFGKMTSVEEAYSLMRKAENFVTNPTAEDNPFGYLRLMCPEFSSAIDMITSFWEKFRSSNIRQRYNYCKHKGKPLYSEINVASGHSAIGSIFLRTNEGCNVELVSNPQDVRLICSLEESINELLTFDNEELFPYISALLSELERVLDLSHCLLVF